VLKVLISIGSLQLVTMFVMMLRTKGLALLLGPELYGLMGVLDRMVAVFGQTISLSLPFSALRYLSPQWEADRPRFFWLFGRMRNVLTGLSLLALLVGVLLVSFVPELLGGQIREHRGLAVLALLGLPTVALVPFLQNSLAASFDHSRAMLFSLLHAVVFSITAVLGVWTLGLNGFYGLYALLGGSLCLVVLRLFARAESSSVPAEAALVERTPTYLPKYVWRFGLLLLAPAFLAPYVAYSVFDQLIASRGQVAGGYMQSAMGLALAVRGVLGAAGQVFLTPLVNRPGNFLERVERANNFQKTLFLLVGIVVPPLVLLSQLAIVVLYSPRFLPAAPYVVLFVTVEILGLAVGNYQAVLLAMDHVVVSVVQNIVAQAAMFLMAAWAIPRWGVVGAGLASLTAQLVLMAGTATFLVWRHGFRPSPRIVALSLYIFASLGCSAWLASTFPGMAWQGLAVKLTAYGVFAGGLAIFPNSEDWLNLRRLGGELRARRAARSLRKQ
jgi:O-antigen/teichoic acid export membrane protein